MLRVAPIVLTGAVVAASAVCQPVALEPGQIVKQNIASGEVQRYSLDLASGQIVRMFFTQTLPFQVTVKLIAPGGQMVVERTSRQNLLLSGVTAVTAQHALEVSAAKTAAAAAGPYRIDHIEIRPAAPEDDALLQADAAYSEFRRAAAASSADAAAKLDAAAALYAQKKQPDFEAWTLLVAGQYWVKLSDYKQAANHYARSAAAFKVAENDVGRARALDFLGDISAVLREHAKAIDAASEALILARANQLPDIESGALSILGRSYSHLGETQRALDYFHQAMTLALSQGDRTHAAAALGDAAALYNSLGNHEKALANYQEALAIHRARGAPLDQAAALSNIGSSYASLGQTAKAVEHLEQAIALFRTTGGGRPALATTLSDCGQAYVAMHSPAKAVPLLEEALTIAKETGNRWSEAYTLMNLGLARDALGDRDGAAGLLAAALAIQTKLGDARVEAVTQYEIARLERARGNLDLAREHSEAAIELVESIRNKVPVPDLRSSLIASTSDYYELQVDLLMLLYRKTGSVARLEQAREAADRGRARNLRDVLAAAGIESSASPDPELAANEQKVRGELNRLSATRTGLLHAKPSAQVKAAIDQQIDDAWIQYQAVRSKLLAANPLALSAAESSPIDLAAIRREVLDPGTILLEYSLGEPRSYLWIISQNEAQAFDLPQRAHIDEAARAFWNAVKAGGDAAAVARAATNLSHMVLAPAGSLLENKRLLIVADGALQYVPFSALADPAQGSVYRPLILNHEIVDEPSASALALLRRGAGERRPAVRALAVFADPVFEKDDPRVRRGSAQLANSTPPPFLTRAAELRFARLPSTRREGRSIASLLPEPERWLALDFDASRAAVTSARLSDYRILHFATHGVVESARPELSALALSLFDAHGQPQDGFLRLFEIYNLKMQAELVVLSACDTALGTNVRGEGLVGLARGFMHAGSPRVVASLWKVDDQATSELMRLFYAGMLGADKKPAAAALRAAQLAVAKQERWRSPYYWAAFVLQGEWR
jgi:CHAT domain-containing protein